MSRAARALPAWSLPSILAVGSLLGIGGFIGIANFWYAYDDAWITYRVARNLASGAGFVFNAGERVLVTTAPLYGLLLGALGWLFGPDRIPFFGGLISAVSFVLGGLALYELGRARVEPLAGWFAGYAFLTNPILFDVFGGEMLSVLALTLWAFAAYLRERRGLCATLLALATLVRPDGALAVAVLVAYDVVRRRRLPWREGAIFAAIVLPFVLAAWAYFGSPLPATLASKLAQRDSGLWLTYGKGLRGWLVTYLMPRVRGPHVELFSLDPLSLSCWMTIGVPAMLWHRGWWLPMAWPVAFVLFYRTLGLPFYHWYAAPAVVALSMLAGSGLSALVALARRAMPRVPRLAPALGIALAIGVTFPWVKTIANGPWLGPIPAQYEAVGRWLDAYAAHDATVAYYEIGVIGYYAPQRIVDPFGLLDPTVPAHVARRDFLYAYERERPTYVLDLESEPQFRPYLSAPWFAREYRPVHVFPGPPLAVQHTLTLWQRVAPGD